MRAEVQAFEMGYRVSDDGTLVGLQGQVRLVHEDKDGYRRFTIRQERKSRSVNVHRLAAYQWFGEALFAAGIEVRHLDGVRTNCSKNNIAIGTRSQNEMDKPAELRRRQAGRAARRLSDEQVAQLRQDRVNGAFVSALSKKYGVSMGTVSNLINNKTCVEENR